tara:strand:+ start:150 stop:419 length:270 start_codon:yes stop_codon:yes gene_type:complete
MRISEAFNDHWLRQRSGFNVVEYIQVETATDAYQILSDDWSLSNYIDKHGDVEVEYDGQYSVYRVPAFAERIERYKAAKQIDCDRWGCE